MNYISIRNNQTIPVADIPMLDYPQFFETNVSLLTNHPERHCVNYFGYNQGNSIKLICCIADDASQEIYISSCHVSPSGMLESMTSRLLCFEKFEREIHEKFGVVFENHPWMKPVRYSHNRADKFSVMDNYPFYSIDSEELHEVGVGPIHAGVIEPGHFRFICNGEQILHLEIQLGYQHRGIEELFLQKKKLLQRVTLAENIAGDTVAGHTSAFCYLWESLSGFEPKPEIDFYRTLALELERIAIHTGDLSAICTDIAYQLGSSVFGRLRTPIINFIQEWGGNRFSKGLIRPGKTQFPFTNELGNRLKKVLNDYEPDFNEICAELFKLPSALSRLERTGTVSYDDILNIGAVGMSARMSGLLRDVRTTHPYALYPQINHQPIIKHHGDVYSRAQIRREEIGQSMVYVRQLLENIPDTKANYDLPNKLQPNAFSISLVEGWRGEICHCAITGHDGELVVYKIKDPSFHNWLALALAVRNNEISDFPICNKSFNLSYCGHDL